MMIIIIPMAPVAQWLGGRAPGSGRSWVQSSPYRTERVTGQTVRSLWRISSSTSGANTSCESKDSSSRKKKTNNNNMMIIMIPEEPASFGDNNKQ